MEQTALIAELRSLPVDVWPRTVEGWHASGRVTGAELQPVLALAWVTPVGSLVSLLPQADWLSLFRDAGFHVYAQPGWKPPSRGVSDTIVWRVARDVTEVHRMSWFEHERSARRYLAMFTSATVSPRLFRASAPAAAVLARYSVPPECDELVVDPAMLANVEQVDPW